MIFYFLYGFLIWVSLGLVLSLMIYVRAYLIIKQKSRVLKNALPQPQTSKDCDEPFILQKA